MYWIRLPPGGSLGYFLLNVGSLNIYVYMAKQHVGVLTQKFQIFAEGGNAFTWNRNRSTGIVFHCPANSMFHLFIMRCILSTDSAECSQDGGAVKVRK